MASDDDALTMTEVMALAEREGPGYLKAHLINEPRMTTATATNLLRLKEADLKIERAKHVEPVSAFVRPYLGFMVLLALLAGGAMYASAWNWVVVVAGFVMIAACMFPMAWKFTGQFAKLFGSS